MSVQEETVVCPWCHTEIMWDPEIGPEKHCPYCGNELSGYRTLQLGIDKIEDGEEDEDEHEHNHDHDADDREWEDDDQNDHGHASRGVAHLGRGGGDLAAQATVERLLETQLEMPECPVCREYLLEAGVETIGEGTFKPAYSKLLKGALISAPFQIVHYVCPSCFHMENKLSKADQDRMIATLAEAAEND
ncbi:putative RNA-binding Zn-ribbon protein involved in translation (DUF1610 family) [Paenibacillus phyllosphaerae]|uniref:Putative RNA-binding Zn-ribbon protein involved in translation (DUF1610 family) n=1 Tax=Paenibacillus phyllosphaerae TaxID=274593 RepID=A0A7W5FRB0_9BACL|nr:hypothetical protein [Paenibacillus phyllosphaerae]MBB3114341.1 putative RNA-binding Zn-ribbon protein involved in translation (DUF1610 family) [Paenibacillus phyllosphaerae]